MVGLTELPLEIRNFAQFLNTVAAVVDRDGSWFREFWQRDPEGMRACLEGREVPPWDVVVCLLQDLAAVQGADSARREGARAHALYRASVRAHDRTYGAEAKLTEQLRLLRSEEEQAAQRLRALEAHRGQLAGVADVRAIDGELAWARDYYGRISGRIAELRGRIAMLAQEQAPVGQPRWDPWQSASTRDQRPAPAPAPAPEPPAVAPPAEPASVTKRRRRGSARFAGLDLDESTESAPAAADPVVGAAASPRGARFSGAPTTAAPATAATPVAPGPGPAAAPRGARFAGAADEVTAPAPGLVSDADRAAVARTVDQLRRLRGENRGGQAHAVLAEAAHGPVVRLPLLAEHLERAGMAADWATLLWEAAALPPEIVLTAANALTATGRSADGERLLRQGMARPAADMGAAVVRLVTREQFPEARDVLEAYLRTRTTAEAARVAGIDPGLLTPVLLDAASLISSEVHDDLVLALRVAGIEPATAR